jgi:diguanylate cyclase (GGDEF)-like protein
MSFRNRLALFFIVIVIVPMIAVAAVLFRLISDNETGKADAGLAEAARAATAVYRQDATGTRARAAVVAVASDHRLARYLERGSATAAARRAQTLVSTLHLARLAVTAGGSSVLVDVGDHSAVAPIVRNLVSANHTPIGQLAVSLETAGALARRVSRTTGANVAISSGGTQLGTTLPGAPAHLPTVGDVSIAGRDYRTTSLRVTGFDNQRVEISLLSPRASTNSSIAHGRLLAAALLAGFFALSFAFALAVSRSLQREIARFLEVARGLAGGDFSARVPAAGHDEFALLGAEFNSMSEQLESRLHELSQQRSRLETSLVRIGETFAANLDRDALLGIVLRTAVDGVGATAGRATVRTDANEALRECARVGPADELQAALHAAEAAALDSEQASAATVGTVSALAHPLRGTDGSDAVLGLLSVARLDRAFEQEERDLFDYLGRQAAVSVENVALHEQVQRQAVTDELTGLYNHRRFQEALELEAERARRFDQSVGLIMLDLDDFKDVNDSYGHQQGDRVLREVAKLMRDHSREIDSPARYGGEELAIVLPQTDLEGAYRLGERIRSAIEGLKIPVGADGKQAMTITASIGVAAMPVSAADADRLMAAADAALYEAKRAGKNKTIQAR